MRKFLLLLVILFGIAPGFGAVQTPPIQITFTCNLAAQKCADYRDLLVSAFNCPPTDVTNAQKIACIQNRTINRLNRLALDQRQFLDVKAQQQTTETTFRADFPDQP